MKTLNVLALSRAEIEKSTSALSNVIISIRSPGERKAIVGGNDPVDVLWLEFNDVDKDGRVWTLNGKMPVETKLFSETDARRVIDFVNKYKDKVELILCQCEAGIARSSGTAAAICAMLGQHKEDGEFWIGKNRYRPNVHVYKTIIRAAGLKYFKGQKDDS